VVDEGRRDVLIDSPVEDSPSGPAGASPTWRGSKRRCCPRPGGGPPFLHRLCRGAPPSLPSSRTGPAGPPGSGSAGATPTSP